MLPGEVLQHQIMHLAVALFLHNTRYMIHFAFLLGYKNFCYSFNSAKIRNPCILLSLMCCLIYTHYVFHLTHPQFGFKQTLSEEKVANSIKK